MNFSKQMPLSSSKIHPVLGPKLGVETCYGYSEYINKCLLDLEPNYL